jgi:hypothetical protein
MSDALSLDRRKRQVARMLCLERAAIQIINRLTEASVPCILLKGAALAQWLYPHELRASIDVDILVPQRLWDQATQAVERLGFALDSLGPTGGNWFRGSDQVWLDLHYTLAGVGVAPDALWMTLWQERDTMPLHRAMMPILNERARLFHVVMHAIQTGNAKTKASEDLARAVKIVPCERWEEAWRLAAALQAERRFAASLRLYAPSGAELADRLGAPTHIPLLACWHAIEGSPASEAVTALIEGNWPQRYTILKRWLWPGRDSSTDLAWGRIPNAPAWVRQCRTRYVKFYLWRCYQVFAFLRTCPAALRLCRAPDQNTYRQTVSQPWRDDR